MLTWACNFVREKATPASQQKICSSRGCISCHKKLLPFCKRDSRFHSSPKIGIEGEFLQITDGNDWWRANVQDKISSDCRGCLPRLDGCIADNLCEVSWMYGSETQEKDVLRKTGMSEKMAKIDTKERQKRELNYKERRKKETQKTQNSYSERQREREIE